MSDESHRTFDSGRVWFYLSKQSQIDQNKKKMKKKKKKKGEKELLGTNYLVTF